MTLNHAIRVRFSVRPYQKQTKQNKENKNHKKLNFFSIQFFYQINTHTPKKMTTFRFVFNEEIMEQITEFSKTHRDDNRKLFKEEWNNWVSQEETKKNIETETHRLRELGFSGDIHEKMFMSARYYFRKKMLTPPEPAPETKPEKIRKQYTTLDKSILELIDTHIQTHTMSSPMSSPSDSYEAFCQENKETITKHSRQIIEDKTNLSQQEDVIRNFIHKIKKSYKNRYYKIVQQKIEKSIITRVE